jgi:hypothetical protein
MSGLVAGAACSAPTAPSAGDLPLTAGTYLVQLRGSELFGIGAGPLMPGCPGISDTGLRTVTTEIDITLESGLWVGRPRSASSGSFELRFLPGPLAPGGPGGGPGVTVTAVGTMVSTLPDAPLDIPVPDSRVIFGTQAALTGGMSSTGTVASGRTSGALSFADSTGTSVACNPGGASWLVSRLASP